MLFLFLIHVCLEMGEGVSVCLAFFFSLLLISIYCAQSDRISNFRACERKWGVNRASVSTGWLLSA